MTIRRITLRVSQADYESFRLAAARQDLSLQGWCERALRRQAGQDRKPRRTGRVTYAELLERE